MKKYLLTALVLFITTSLCKAQIFYGMTFSGGSSADSYGAIIRFNAATDKDSVVWNFAGSPSDGEFPYGNLVYDTSNGFFYAMTYEGGSNDLGAIISFNPITNKDSLVWSFAGYPTDGSAPFGDLVYNAGNGLFYGMTAVGGDDEVGTIISFNPVNSKDSVVWNFTGRPLDGAGPTGDLIYEASTELFYGMTGGGGTYDKGAGSGGTIFSFNTATSKDSMLWSFGAGTDGSIPVGNLVYDASTRLFYGMTHDGGTNDTANGGYGTIISFDPTTHKESVVWSFAGLPTDGEYPNGSLVYDTSTGLLYGMTIDGGNGGYGAIISFDPSTNKESLLGSFGSGTDGSRPLGSLIYDWGNKLLYGMTQWGGTNGTGTKDGTIFSFDTNGNSENVLWDFGSGADGATPFGSLVLYSPSVKTGIKQLSIDNGQLTIYPNPTSGEFTIESDGNQSGYTFEVYNIMGEKIYESVLTNSQNSINLSNQTDGLYFVYLRSDNDLQVGKVMIIK